MQIPKPSDAEKQAFVAAVGSLDGVVVKPMFGNVGAFVNGNMFAGLFGPDLGVRLTDATSLEQLARLPGAHAFGPAERPMGGYLALPANWADQPSMVSDWIGLALRQVAALPPKVAKPRKR